MSDPAAKRCPVCLKWFMSTAQRDHHLTIRHKEATSG